MGLGKGIKGLGEEIKTRTKVIKGSFLFSNILIFSISFNKGIIEVSEYR